jgi:hypothetical protein
MYFRGAEIRRIGHGRCAPPFDSTQSNDTAKFGAHWVTRNGGHRLPTAGLHRCKWSAQSTHHAAREIRQD